MEIVRRVAQTLTSSTPFAFLPPAVENHLEVHPAVACHVVAVENHLAVHPAVAAAVGAKVAKAVA